LRGENSVSLNLSDGSQEKLDHDFVGVAYPAFSPDGRLLAIASGYGLVQVWNTVTWHQRTLTGYMQGLVSVAFSPDGRRLVSGGDTTEALRFYDTESWQDVLTIDSKEADFAQTAFSPSPRMEIPSAPRRGAIP